MCRMFTSQSYSKSYHRRALKHEVKAARCSCKLATREVRQQNILSETLHLSEQLQESVRVFSDIIDDRVAEDSRQRRREFTSRHDSSRRSSRRSPPPGDSTASRPPPGPIGPSSPVEASARSQAPPSPPSPTSYRNSGVSTSSQRGLSEPPADVVKESSQAGEEKPVTPLETRDPRYFRDFRNEPFPDRASPATERHLTEEAAAEGTGAPEETNGQTSEQGAYVNPENPQDRRRKLPSGKLSDEKNEGRLD